MSLQSARAIIRGAMKAARNPRLLARLNSLDASERREQRYRDIVQKELGGPPRTVPIERLLAPTVCRVAPVSLLDDSAGIADLLLLTSLAARVPASHVFEVGTFRGESALAMAASAAEVVTVALPASEMARRGMDPQFIAAHGVFLHDRSNIRQIHADSHTLDLAPYRNWADVVFVDGDHSFDGVVRDTTRLWPVRRPEGILAWHDGFETPLKPRWEVLAAIATAVPEPSRAGLVHVSHTQCVVWLPDAASLPTVARSYVPRVRFAVEAQVV